MLSGWPLPGGRGPCVDSGAGHLTIQPCELLQRVQIETTAAMRSGAMPVLRCQKCGAESQRPRAARVAMRWVVLVLVLVMVVCCWGGGAEARVVPSLARPSSVFQGRSDLVLGVLRQQEAPISNNAPARASRDQINRSSLLAEETKRSALIARQAPV